MAERRGALRYNQGQDMLTRNEITGIMVEFLRSIDDKSAGAGTTCDRGFLKKVDSYDVARDNLERLNVPAGFSDINSLAEYVVDAYRVCAKGLIKWTSLLQEEDIRLGVEILVESGLERSRKRNPGLSSEELSQERTKHYRFDQLEVDDGLGSEK